jgi:hypothetical protein
VKTDARTAKEHSKKHTIIKKKKSHINSFSSMRKNASKQKKGCSTALTADKREEQKLEMKDSCSLSKTPIILALSP